jgi:predicted ATPase
MKRYILTGTPGAGKTAILRQLECDGFSVVEEAATDLIALRQAQGIAEPWTRPSFIDAVVELQKHRERRAALETSVVQFHDRSVICTVALAAYLGFPATDVLTCEVNRIVTEAIFEKRVFFIRSLGFIARTEARRITLDEAVRFEKIHEEMYREFGFEIVSIPPGSVAERVAAIARAISEASQ